MGNRAAAESANRSVPPGPTAVPPRPSALQRSLWVAALLVALAWIGFLLVLVLRR
jgi:hypothetical protein